VAINAILFLNKTNISGATPAQVENKYAVCRRFWECVREIEGIGEDEAKIKTVAAQPVVLKALAKLVFDHAFNSRKPPNADDLLEKIFDGITEVDFSHRNPAWRYYELSDQEIKDSGLEGLSAYLPSSEGGNRDIGSFQDSTMRFGAKHNDIYPIIGDILRWQMGLPSRHESHVKVADIL
jgi:hypothetical protein